MQQLSHHHSYPLACLATLIFHIIPHLLTGGKRTLYLLFCPGIFVALIRAARTHFSYFYRKSLLRPFVYLQQEEPRKNDPEKKKHTPEVNLSWPRQWRHHTRVNNSYAKNGFKKFQNVNYVGL